jgi:glutamate synthase (NADPH/NADH) small chain
LIPEWNDLVYRGRIDEAVARLHATNNFPEVTGRVCPAPCEASCVLNIEETPVTIKMVEKTIGDHAIAAGFAPRPSSTKSGRRVAVIGSGPAGLAAAQQLARAGHDVVCFERDDRIGGLLRYGIPDFKMEKGILDLRAEQMRAEGVSFQTGVEIGRGLSAQTLARDFDAIVVAVGARKPRDLAIPGRELAGVHFAMEFLEQQNRRVAGDRIDGDILATGKHVVVIGGGDTGSDCIGTSVRQGAASVAQLELMPKPPLVRVPANPWPEWPLVLRTSSSQEEGADRDWAVSTKRFVGEGAVTHLETVRVKFESGKMHEIEGSAHLIPCDLALLAMGFVGAERGDGAAGDRPKGSPLAEELSLAYDPRGNLVAAPARGIFVAGDASRGQSLVVWAIAEGRRAAADVDAYLRAASRQTA